MLILCEPEQIERIPVRREMTSPHIRYILQNNICCGLVDGWFLSDDGSEYFCYERNRYIGYEEYIREEGKKVEEDGKTILMFLKKLLWIRIDAIEHFLPPELISFDHHALYLRKNARNTEWKTPVLLPNLKREECVTSLRPILESFFSSSSDPVWNRYRNRLMTDLEKSKDLYEMAYCLEKAEKELFGVNENPLA